MPWSRNCPAICTKPQAAIKTARAENDFQSARRATSSSAGSASAAETLSLSVRHEIRENNPDGTSPDYKRLKVLLGFDF